MIKGKVQTVLGAVDPGDLGVTLCHEHLSMSFDVAYVSTNNAARENAPYALENLGWIRQNPYSHPYNLQINDAPSRKAIIEDVKLFKASGGGTLVENSTLGLMRDMDYVVDVSRQTGVHVVAGTGYYVGASLPVAFDGWTVEKLADDLVNDLTVGVGKDRVKCGVIGEIGCSWPLQDREKKSLRAAGRVQEALGCPVIIHPGRHQDSPGEVVRILQEAGGNAAKTIMSHLDRTFETKESVLEFAATGCLCEYDLFGIESSFYQLRSISMPNDGERIRRIQWLIADGRLDQVVIAQDIHTKHRLVQFGGHGYSHILDNVVPMMLQWAGMDQRTVDQILIDNPRKWLTT